MPLYPSKVLRARECALIPYSFVIFCLDSYLSPLRNWECVTWYQSSCRARFTHLGVPMEPKKTRKLIQETMVEKPTQDREVPPEAIREEEQKDFEEQEA